MKGMKEYRGLVVIRVFVHGLQGKVEEVMKGKRGMKAIGCGVVNSL